MAYESIAVEPVSPGIGAEISGVDLAEPLGNRTFAEIHDALMEYQTRKSLWYFALPCSTVKPKENGATKRCVRMIHHAGV